MEIKLTTVRSVLRKRLLMVIMRTFIFLVCTTVFGFVSETTFSQEKINIKHDQLVTVDQIFKIIRQQTEYNFMYPKKMFNDAPKVQLKKGTIRVDELLKKSIEIDKFMFVLSTNNTIIINLKSRHQQRQVNGVVTDEEGQPLLGVTVRVKGRQAGVATDIHGRYNLLVVDGANVIVFSYMGFETQEIMVANQTIIDITLRESVSELSEVVINAGYYKTSQRLKTGNIAKVTAKIIDKQPVNNPLGAIQGRLTGVNIVQETGVPGGGFSIEIRGKNFINGSTNPLFVIDGVPFGAESLESFQLSGQINAGNVSPLNAINSQDIESIEVLKDADATAIYGSRGANGVVLITTKKGKAGKTQFSANGSTTIGQVSHYRDLMNTEQYLEVRREGIETDGYGAYLENPAFDFVWPDLKTWDQDRNTDWQKELIGGTAYRNNMQLSISGGGDQTQFLVSGAHQNETTVFPGDSKYEKTSVHSNFTHRSKDERFSLIFSTNFTLENNKLPRTDLTSLAYTVEPNAPAIFDDEGNLNWENNTFNNPFGSLKEDYQVQISTLLANMVLTYQLLPNLTVSSSFGYNNVNFDSNRILPSTARNPSFGFTSRSYSQINVNTSNRNSWIVEPQLNWKHQWQGLKLDVLLGTTFQQETSAQFIQKGQGFASNALIRNLSAAETLQVLQDGDSEYSYQAFYGRVNVNFNNKYILNLTGRRDGSSRFGPGKNFGNFGAIGAAWIFTNENVFKNKELFSFGKIRTSYGITGSDNIGDYRFLDTFSTTGNAYNGVSTIEPSGIFNPLLAWEENKKMEIALELGFFKDRVFLNTSWYQNRSSNQLIGIPLAATTGFNSIDGNFDATVENTGFEIDVSTSNIRGENFNWTTSFNLTVPRNKLLKFEGIESSTFANTYKVGESLNILHFYHSLGVDPDTGIYQFEDYNEDGKISRVEDSYIIKDLSPKYYGGITNELSYKNISLNFFFQFKKQLGFNIYREIGSPGFRVNGPVELYTNRWVAPGDEATIQRSSASLNFSNGISTASNNQRFSDATLSDASFIRLRSVTLSYKVPQNLIRGLDLDLYMQGQNLLTITNYKYRDPEQVSNGILPQLRQFTLGLNIGF